VSNKVVADVPVEFVQGEEHVMCNSYKWQCGDGGCRI